MEQIAIKLQDHERELEQAKGILSKVEKEYKWYRDTKVEIPHRKMHTLVYMTSTVLDLIGELSMTRFDVRDSMEEDYKKKYLNSPALGKKIFLEHYEGLHKPYDKVKNKCFDLLRKIDPDCVIDLE